MEDALHIEDDEDRLSDEPNWTLDKLQFSFSDNVRLRVQSVFDDVEMT